MRESKFHVTIYLVVLIRCYNLGYSKNTQISAFTYVYKRFRFLLYIQIIVDLNFIVYKVVSRVFFCSKTL